MELVEDGLDPGGCLFGGTLVNGAVEFLLGPALVARVVGADHEHDEPGLESVEIPVLKPPEHVLGAVAANAKVCGMERGPVFLPDLPSLALPAVGDGVSEEDELGLAPFGNFVEAFVPFFRARMQDGLGCVVDRGLGGQQRQGGCEQGEDEAQFHGV